MEEPKKDPEPIDVVGLISIAEGSDASDQSLRATFAKAAEYGCPARFLRLGGPKQFRADIIAILDETGMALSPGYRMLLDSRIPEIEFLLVSPFSESFLTRMDAEHKSNWDIWRVREQVMEFARGLIRAGQQRAVRKLSRIRVGFHYQDLIWNLGIVDDHEVTARAYFGTATGHDNSVAEVVLQVNAPSRLADSLVAYYNSVKKDNRTDFFHSESDLRSIGSWPSLFKGNAVFASSDASGKWFEKSCVSEAGNRAEEILMTLTRSAPAGWAYFNPVKLGRCKAQEEPWEGQTLSVRRINGMMASDLMAAIHQIAEIEPELTPKLELLSGSILYQAFQSLKEFRSAVLENEVTRGELQIYPWAQKLESAVQEAARFVLESPRELASLAREAKRLGKSLEASASQPFRDAHLKNRMVALDRSWLEDDFRGLRDWLEMMRPEEVFEWLRRNTYDIDFETSLWKVSEWDDVLHILWSNYTGREHARELEDEFNLFEPWWTPPSTPAEEEVMWATVLSRSLREFCRRLWYSRIMPETYKKRYSAEKREYFLELALEAAEHIDGYTAIKNFLDRCQMAGSALWTEPAAEGVQETVVARYPSFIDRTEPGSTKAAPGIGPVLMPAPENSIQTPVKILFLAADPSDGRHIRLDREIREIEEALSQTEYGHCFHIDQHWAVRVSDLQKYLLLHKPNIVHFSGHGNKSSNIILEDHAGNSQPVSTRALSRLFSLLKDNIQCVVLNACYSEEQAQAIAKHIECVIGMSQTILDSTSASFAKAFYQGLGFGKDVQTAFELGCVELEMLDQGGEDVPKLLCLRKNASAIRFAPK